MLQRSYKKSGYKHPLEMMPFNIKNEEMISAMKKCTEENKDSLYEILQVVFVEGVMY